MSVELHSFSDRRTLERFEARIVEVYGAAFSEPPYSQGEDGVRNVANRLPRHARNAGFRCLVAEENDQVLGFVYGYTDEPGGWWHEQVAPSMEAAGLERWLRNAFALTELAVAPQARGRGVGGRLHDTLLDSLPHRRSLLSTHQEKTVARKLYDKRGWIVLLDGFVYPAGGDAVVIMGLDLSSHRTHPRPASRR
ncbi:MAG: GNAT family N-acetyltransferase [Rubrobacteraceae bacterium]